MTVQSGLSGAAQCLCGALYCKSCQEPTVFAVQNDMESKERCDMYMLKLSERVEALEVEIKKKTDNSEIGKLQAQIKELEEASLAKQTDLEVKL